jgi:peptidoglycan hydrolase-like protein with peptidoglycan-binding domain
METTMDTTRTTRTRALKWAAVPILALGLLAGCSSSDETNTANTSTTATPGSTAPGTTSTTVDETAAFDKTVQQQLKDVGCYAGAVDGIMGPATDSAILAFQSAMGLETDGELGPETKSALASAVSKKETVCKAPTSTTTTSTKPGTTSTTAAGGGIAPCTATALALAMPQGTTINSFICSGEYAAGSNTGTGGSPTPFLLVSVNGAWGDPSQSPCGTASAGIPPIILETGCPKP